MEHVPFPITPARQPRGSKLCGPAAASMVLSRYGISQSAHAVARALPMVKKGISNAPLGTYFLERGFSVTLFYWLRGIQPKFMGTTAYNAVSKALDEPLGDMAAPDDKATWLRGVRNMRRFLDAGGDIRLEPLQARHLELVLSAGWPPIVNLNPRILDSYGDSDTGHFVVPVLLDGPVIGFYDPVSGRLQRRSLDAFMHACHLWHGAGLIISPRDVRPDFDA